MKSIYNGKSCIFITHNLFHVNPVADRIIVLYRGKIVETFVKGQIGLEQTGGQDAGDPRS